MKYQVVVAQYIKELEKKVNDLTAQGWEPQGGLVAVSNSSGVAGYFMQAIIKEENEG